MRFISLIIVLLTATTIYSLNLPESLFKILNELLSEECDSAIKKICNLPEDLTKNNIEEACTQYSSHKCQNLFKNGISSIPECSNSNDIVLIGQKELFKLYQSIYNYMCTKNEQGNRCSYVEYYLEKGIDTDINIKEEEAEVLKIIDKTCQSKICTDLLYENFYNLLNIENKITSKISINRRDFAIPEGLTDEEKTKKLLEYLKSNECSSQALIVNQTSNAYSLRFKSVIIVSLSLIFYILF